MKFKIFYGLFVLTTFLLISSFSSAQNIESVSNKEKISFTNIKYLDTIQNTKPAKGIPGVNVNYWMKTVFKDIKNVKNNKGYIEFTDKTLSDDYLKQINQKPKILKHYISSSNVYYCDIEKVPHAVIFLYHHNEIPDYIYIHSLTQDKFYEYENTTMSIIELKFKENKWVLKNHHEDLKNCLSYGEIHQSVVALGWNFWFSTPKLVSLESNHHFVLTENTSNSLYFQDMNSMNFFQIGSYEISAISFESLNEFSFKDYDSSLIEYITYSHFQDLKPYKKTESIKFFLDNGVLHAEISQEGFIYDPEKEKEVPQNAKTYYRYLEEKKIFTKLE